MTTLLRKVRSTWELDAITYQLTTAGIEFHTVRSAREYTSILLGGDDDCFDIFVEEKDLKKAQDFLKTEPLKAESSEPQVTEKNYFKRVVFFSMASVVLAPILFNLAASLNFGPMLKQNISWKLKVFATVIFLTMWAGAVAAVIFLVSRLPQSKVGHHESAQARASLHQYELEITQQSCANRSEELPPGTSTEPTEEYPLNGLWKLTSVACEGGLPNKKLQERNEDLKSGKMSRLVRVMESGTQYRLVDYDAKGNSCVTCMHARWKLDPAKLSLEPQEIVGHTASHGQRNECGSFTAPPAIKYQYELKDSNLILRVQGEGFGLCESGVETLIYLNIMK